MERTEDLVEAQKVEAHLRLGFMAQGERPVWEEGLHPFRGSERAQLDGEERSGRLFEI